MKYFLILLIMRINISTILLGQSIELPQKFMNKDEIKNIPIFIYNVTSLESIQLKIEYDANVVSAEYIIENPVGILDGGYTFTTNLTEPGIIILAIGSNSANVFSGSGMIAQIPFESIGELGFSALTFLDAQINSELVLGTAIDGSIEIILDESGYSKMLKDKKDLESEGRLENLKELIRGMRDFDNLQSFLEHVP